MKDSEYRRSIRYPVAIDAGLGRLAEERSYPKHVDQLARQLLLTGPGERVNRPDFGCGVRQLLFAGNDVTSTGLIQATIQQSMTRWLGDVLQVERIAVNAVDSTVEITVSYTLKATGEKRDLNVGVIS